MTIDRQEHRHNSDTYAHAHGTYTHSSQQLPVLPYIT